MEEASSALVIKVKYGEIMRRFNAPIVEEELVLSMNRLKQKILSLLSFASDTELVLTYRDEDGDVVNLVDDDDLCDAVKQGLNPLRITVELGFKQAKHQLCSRGNSTPWISHQVQEALQHRFAGVTEILKINPEPLCETVVKLATDLASKALSSAPAILELGHYMKVGLSYLGEFSEFQTRVEPSTNRDPVETETKDTYMSEINATIRKVPLSGIEVQASPSSDCLQELQPEAPIGNDNMDLRNVTGRQMGTSSNSHGLEAESSCLDPRDDNIGKKEKGGKTNDCYSNETMCKNLMLDILEESYYESYLLSIGINLPTEDEVNKPDEPYVGPKSAYIGEPSVPSLMCPSFSMSYRITSLPATFKPASKEFPFRSSRGQTTHAGDGTVFHQEACCEGCCSHPKTGGRVESRVKAETAPCRVCFSKMCQCRAPMPPQICIRGSTLTSQTTKLYSCFVKVVNVLDGNVIAPSTPFTKIWRMRNNGTAVWPQETRLTWICGHMFRDKHYIELDIPAAGLPVDNELDIALDFIAPERSGLYSSCWRMVSPSGQHFGQCVWVFIQVNTSPKEMPSPDIRGLNPNITPVSIGIPVGPETSILEDQLLFDDHFSDFSYASSSVSSDHFSDFSYVSSSVSSDHCSCSYPSSSTVSTSNSPTRAKGEFMTELD